MLDHPVELLRPFAFAAADNNIYILLHDRYIYTYDSDDTEIMETRAQSALSKFREHACILCAMLESHVHVRFWNRDR